MQPRWGCLVPFGRDRTQKGQDTRAIPVSAARGDHSIVTVEIYRGHGVTLNFRPSGDTIRRAWLDDPSQVTLDFDDTRCGFVAALESARLKSFICGESIPSLSLVYRPLAPPH